MQYSTTGGVCQYDLFKAPSGGKREVKGFLGRPPGGPPQRAYPYPGLRTDSEVLHFLTSFKRS